MSDSITLHSLSFSSGAMTYGTVTEGLNATEYGSVNMGMGSPIFGAGKTTSAAGEERLKRR